MELVQRWPACMSFGDSNPIRCYVLVGNNNQHYSVHHDVIALEARSAWEACQHCYLHWACATVPPHQHSVAVLVHNFGEQYSSCYGQTVVEAW